MDVLFVADVFGRPGRDALDRTLTRVRAERPPDLVIVNGENAAGGFGITPSIARGFLAERGDLHEAPRRIERPPRGADLFGLLSSSH